MRGSQLIGLSLVTRHRGQWHSTCVKPSAANSSMVACNGSMIRSIAGQTAPLKFALTQTSKKGDRPLGAL